MRNTLRPGTLTLLFTVPLLLPGCASVLNGKRQALPVDSDPPGASASWGGQRADTPGTLVVPRKVDGVRIVFEKPGYASCAVTLERGRSGAFWANLAFIPLGVLAGGEVGAANQGKGLDGWARNLDQAAAGAAVGGVLFPVGAMVVDSVGGGGYAQRPGKIVAVLRADVAGRPRVEGQEPACRLRGSTKEPGGTKATAGSDAVETAAGRLRTPG